MKEFDLFFELPAEIRQHKEVNYTIKVIGGPEEYKEYLKEKEKRLEAERTAKREAYLVRRTLLEGIITGEIEASPQAHAAADEALRIEKAYRESKNSLHFKVT